MPEESRSPEEVYDGYKKAFSEREESLEALHSDSSDTELSERISGLSSAQDKLRNTVEDAQDYNADQPLETYVEPEPEPEPSLPSQPELLESLSEAEYVNQATESIRTTLEKHRARMDSQWSNADKKDHPHRDIWNANLQMRVDFLEKRLAENILFARGFYENPGIASRTYEEQSLTPELVVNLKYKLRTRYQQLRGVQLIQKMHMEHLLSNGLFEVARDRDYPYKDEIQRDYHRLPRNTEGHLPQPSIMDMEDAFGYHDYGLTAEMLAFRTEISMLREELEALGDDITVGYVKSRMQELYDRSIQAIQADIGELESIVDAATPSSEKAQEDSRG